MQDALRGQTAEIAVHPLTGGQEQTLPELEGSWGLRTGRQDPFAFRSVGGCAGHWWVIRLDGGGDDERNPGPLRRGRGSPRDGREQRGLPGQVTVDGAHDGGERR